MKFYNIKDIDGFFDTVQTCEGTVELLTSEGDCLNLKSQLSKLIAFNAYYSFAASFFLPRRFLKNAFTGLSNPAIPFGMKIMTRISTRP